MTLFKQIIIVLSIFQTLIFGAVMWFNFSSSNEYVTEQAYTDALHTANSLGLSISSVASLEDVSMAETMINSVFDSGYYEKILLEDMEKNVLVSKEQAVIVADVPAWFVEYINVNVPVASSQIMLGWTPYGMLHVKLNSGHAYRQLWTIFKDVLAVFVGVSLLGVVCLHFILRLILQPLTRVKEQAEAILENDFIFQKNIPFTQELKNVVFAMNSMVRKVKEIFEKEAEAVKRYHELLYYDATTHLYNRRYLTLKLNEYLSSESKEAQGALMLISLNDYEGMKAHLGYAKSEACIKAIAEAIQTITEAYKASVCAKLNETDFAILVPLSSLELPLPLCEEITTAIKAVMQQGYGLDEKEYFTTIGYAHYTQKIEPKELFSKADFALSASKAKGAFSIHHFEETNGEVPLILGKEAWLHELKSAMESKRFKLAHQEVVRLDNGKDIFHSELFVRLEDQHQHIHHAGYFMPMVMDVKLGAQLDHYVIERSLELLEEKRFTCKALCINLGKDIFLQSNEWTWLENAVMKFKKVGMSKLYFEIACGMDVPIELLVKFSKYIRSFGYGLGMDNVVVTKEGLESIAQINPAYIKIHASYMIDLFGESGLETPHRSLGIIADSMDIKIIATNVETLEQKEKLEKIGIHYIQGSLIAEPKMIG